MLTIGTPFRPSLGATQLELPVDWWPGGVLTLTVIAAGAAVAAVRARRARRQDPDPPEQDSDRSIEPQAATAPPRLFGRAEEIAQIGAALPGFVVIHGAPGTGKTDLLRGYIHDARAIAPGLVQLRTSPGSLQAGLAQSLGYAMADLVTLEGTGQRVARIMADAVEAVGHTRISELAGATAAIVGDFMLQRLGESGAALVRDLAAEIANGRNASLAARIETATNPDVIQVLMTLAAELQRASNRPLLLSLDSVERLSEDDFRYLIDLVSELPGRVSLLVTLSTSTGDNRQRVLRLLEESATEIALAGLPLSAVKTWLDAEGVEPHHLPQIMRVTDGFPLYVNAAVGEVRSGAPLHELPAPQSFIAQTDGLLRRLTPTQRKAATLLAAFTDPPPTDFVTTALGVDLGDWVIIEDDLITARMFVSNVQGRPWFHEVRRRAIWDRCLTETQRSFSARAALDWLLPVVSERRVTLQRCIDFASLCKFSDAFVDEHKKLRAVLELDDQQLKVLAAIIELGENEGGAVRAVSALGHARLTLGAQGDLVETLTSLEGAGLVVLAANQHDAVAVPYYESAAARAAVLGRIARDLDRAVIPKLASAVFQGLIQPALGKFVAGQHGIGDPGPTQMSQWLTDMEVDREGPHVSLHTRPGIIIRAHVGDVRTYAAINFKSEKRRDKAVARLSGMRDDFSFGAPFEVDSVASWPFQDAPLPSSRFASAVELLTGSRPGPHGRFFGAGAYSPPAPASLRDELELRLRWHRTLRDLSDPLLRSILGLDQPLGFVYFEREDRAVLSEVSGLDAVKQIPAVDDVFGPYFSSRIAQVADLERGQETRHFRSQGAAPQDPTASVISSTEEKIHNFNRAQKRQHQVVPLDERLMHGMLLAALNRRTTDAAAILDAGLIEPNEQRELHQTCFVIVRPGQEQDGWVTGAHGSMFSLNVPGGDENVLHLRIVDDEDPSLGRDVASFQSVFGHGVPSEGWPGWAALLYGLARALDYGRTESVIRLTPRAEAPPEG